MEKRERKEGAAQRSTSTMVKGKERGRRGRTLFLEQLA